MGYLENKRLFLAGATGCAGANILNYVLEHYSRTTIRATYFHTQPFIHHPRVEYVFCDLKSLEECRKAARGCDCAVMVAANTAGANIIAASPSSHVTDNLIMNVQMLEAFHAEAIQRIVYVGSASLYPEFNGSIQEDQLDWNQDPHPAYFGYGWVVRCTEKLCKYWHDVHGKEILITRTANIYGPYAKFDPERSNFIPAIIHKAVAKMEPFEIWGNPEVTRDVLYAPDFGRAVAMMIDNDRIQFDIFNLCSGTQTRVADVVKWALQYAGHSPKNIEYLPNRPTTIQFRALDNGKIKSRLGWEPRVSPEEGIQATTQWWMENREKWTK